MGDLGDFNGTVSFSLNSVEGILIQNTHESICGVVGKPPVFHRFESQPPRLRKDDVSHFSFLLHQHSIIGSIVRVKLSDSLFKIGDSPFEERLVFITIDVFCHISSNPFGMTHFPEDSAVWAADALDAEH